MLHKGTNGFLPASSKNLTKLLQKIDRLTVRLYYIHVQHVRLFQILGFGKFFSGFKSKGFLIRWEKATYLYFGCNRTTSTYNIIISHNELSMWCQKYDLLARWRVHAVMNLHTKYVPRTRILHRVLYMWTLLNQLHPFPVLLKERGWRDHVQVLNERIKRCFNQSPKCVSSESSISAFELPGH